MRRRKLSSGWIWPGLRAGLFAAFVSGILLYVVLLVFFPHLFTSSYDYMVAPILFVSHLSLIFGLMGLVVGLFWRIAYKMARRRAYREEARSLCICSCVAGAGAFFAAARVAFAVFPGEDARTVLGLLAVAVAAVGAVWFLYRRIFRRLWVALMPSNRGALALIILSAFGTVLGNSVRSEYLTERPQGYVEGITEQGFPVGEGPVRTAGSRRTAPAADNGSGAQANDREAGRPADVADEAAGGAAGDGRANLLLLTVDTLRFDHLGCYGYPRNTTPAIDSLAADGVLFAHAYAQRPKTSPNFATILTGTYPQRHGVRRTKQTLPGSALTLAEVLKASGYTTCGIVTNGNLYPAFGFDQGFDEYEYGHGGAQLGTVIALEWMREQKRRPFFLWVHHTDPHAPYRPPAPYDDVFAGEVEYGNYPLEIVRESALGGVHPKLLIEGPLDLDYYISQYDGEIAYTDYWMGVMLEGLRAYGMAQNTLLVFTSDHGESLGEHNYYFEHGLLAYDQSARIPLVFSLPGAMGRGAVEDVVFESVDMMPTILELLRMQIPPTCQGRSLLGMAGSLTDPGATGPGRIEASVTVGGPGGFRGGSAEPVDAAGAVASGKNSAGEGDAGREARDETEASGSETEGAATRRLAYIEAGVGHHSGPGYTFAMTNGRYKLVVRDIAWIVRPHHVLDFVYMLNALFEGGAADHELYDLEADPCETTNRLDEFPEVAQRLRAELDDFIERMKSEGALPPDAEERPLDEKTVRSLRALGYAN